MWPSSLQGTTTLEMKQHGVEEKTISGGIIEHVEKRKVESYGRSEESSRPSAQYDWEINEQECF
jgi:hypothetical protein